MPNTMSQIIRQTVLQIRNEVPAHLQKIRSNKISNNIRMLNQYRYAKHIALYHSLNGEVDLAKLWLSAPLHGKYCYFPKICDDYRLIFLPATPASNFYVNHFGILEPDVEHHHAIPVEQLDIIFTPLVAFDRFGTRIGMGKGYYDRALANARPKLLLGVAYDFQQYPHIMPEPWDVPMDAIVTDKTTYWSEKCPDVGS